MNFSKIFITLKLSHRLQFSENQTIYYIIKLSVFGCPYCLHPGTTIKTSSSGAGHSHVCTCDRETNGKTKERTHEETVCLAIEAERLKKQGKSKTVVTKGVKGLSWSMYLPKFDVTSGTAIDYMHSVLLGVVKMLLTLWTDKSYNSEPWFLGADKGQTRSKSLKSSL